MPCATRLKAHIIHFCKNIETLLSRLSGLIIVPVQYRSAVQMAQIDTRSRLSSKMAVVGEIVLLAFAYGYVGKPRTASFFIFVILVSVSYGALVWLGQSWKRSQRKSKFVPNFHWGYCVTQFTLGAAWAGVVSAALPQADKDQLAQIYAILIGLVGTAVFAGPAIYSLLFWTPLVFGSTIALILPSAQTNGATLIGIFSFYFLTFVSIIELSRKMVEREVGTIRIAHHKEETEILLRDFQQGASDWFFELDRDLMIVNPSDRFCEVAQRSVTEMQISFHNLLLNGDGSIIRHRDDAIDKLMTHLEGHTIFRDAIVSIPFSGELRWWDLSGKPIFDESGSFVGYRGVGRDVTDLHRSRERVVYLARHDPLTSLLNREMFSIALEQSPHDADAMQTAILCVDLDYFKSINDSFGHGVGDNLLRAAAERLRSCVRERDMVFRLGGDEFAIILPEVERSDVELIAKRIIDHLAQPFRIRNLTMTIGASIGAAMLPTDANSPAGAHHCADIALYQAKVEGRGKFCFFDARTQDAISKRITIHTDLKSPAVRQQLFLEYQPIIDLRTGKPIAMEALVRWQHPVRGVINPTDFISIAEDSGFINVIGKHVIDMTCRSAALMTPNLEFAINLSPRQLRDEMLPDKISEVLHKNDIDGRRISFEITETCLLDVGGNSLGLLDKIRALGCRIVLDDFGTGYSSFRPLHNYDFDRIKIAQALLDDVFLSPSRQIILETVVAMGQRIGIDMIAEGVETEQQAALLRSLDCPLAQGFWFSRPISDAQLIREYGVANTL